MALWEIGWLGMTQRVVTEASDRRFCGAEKQQLLSFFCYFKSWYIRHKLTIWKTHQNSHKKSVLRHFLAFGAVSKKCTRSPCIKTCFQRWYGFGLCLYCDCSLTLFRNSEVLRCGKFAYFFQTICPFCENVKNSYCLKPNDIH